MRHSLEIIFVLVAYLCFCFGPIRSGLLQLDKIHTLLAANNITFTKIGTSVFHLDVTPLLGNATEAKKCLWRGLSLLSHR